jgi:hypothetical protein
MSQTQMTANADILSSLTGPRLAMLEASNLARRFSIETGPLRRGLEQLIARAENRIIERVLVSRLKFALRQAGSLEAAELHIAQMRGGYESGALETLPSFMPRGLTARTRRAAGATQTGNQVTCSRLPATGLIILYVAGAASSCRHRESRRPWFSGSPKPSTARS